MSLKIGVIIPAYNEEASIGKVLQEIPKNLNAEIVVVNNNSSDNTAVVASSNGAIVLTEKIPGYGNACLKGIQYFKDKLECPHIIVFLDGDYSDYPSEMTALIEPIISENMDLVIGSRTLGKREKHSLTPQQIFGNWLATKLMHWFYGIKFSDLGPFRAIKFDKLMALGMVDKTYGWTVEMQIKACKQKLNCCEVPVKYRKRIGVSKVSGTLKGSVMAGYKILYLLFKNLF